MFKRLFWLTIGASFGFGLSFWLTRMIKQTMERYAPQRVSADLTSALRRFGQDLKDAAAEGRVAMREHEAALRADLAGRQPVAVGAEGSRAFTSPGPGLSPPESAQPGSAYPQPTGPRRPARSAPDGTRQRPLRATGRLRVAEPDPEVAERQEVRR